MLFFRAEFGDFLDVNFHKTSAARLLIVLDLAQEGIAVGGDGTELLGHEAVIARVATWHLSPESLPGGDFKVFFDIACLIPLLADLRIGGIHVHLEVLFGAFAAGVDGCERCFVQEVCLCEGAPGISRGF